MKMQFDTLIIFNDKEIIDVVYSRGVGMLIALKNTNIWESILESLEENDFFVPDTIEELIAYFNMPSLVKNTSIKLDYRTKQIYFNH